MMLKKISKIKEYKFRKSRNIKNHMKTNFSYVMMLGFTILLSSACTGGEPSDTTKEPTIPLVKLTKVKAEPVRQIQIYSATVQGDVKNNIAPATPSRIDEIFVEVGDNVKKGERLVNMDESTLSQLELQIKNQEVEFNRVDELYKVGGISKSEWDNVSMALKVNKNVYSNILKNTRLLSPIDGIVTARNYDNGDMYSGLPILVIEKISPAKLFINVSEQYYSVVKKGDIAVVELDAYAEEIFQGRVSLIHPTIDKNTRTFPVEIQVENMEKKLRPGMFARVTLNLGTENRVVVPDMAIVKRSGSGERYVYVYENGKVSFSIVQLGQRLGDRYELLSGVPDNASIVVAGQAKLNDGMMVEVEK